MSCLVNQKNTQSIEPGRANIEPGSHTHSFIMRREKEILDDIDLQPLNNNKLLPEENLNNSQSPSKEVMTDSLVENESVNVSEKQVLHHSTRERCPTDCFTYDCEHMC